MTSQLIIAIWAEMKLIYADLLRRKYYLLMLAAYPYILMIFILLIGMGIGSRQIFIQRIGVSPEIFFIVSGFLLMSIMGVSDDLLWRPVFDEWIGTLPYVIVSHVSRLYHYLAIPIPRLLIALFTGLTSVLPVMVYYYGLQGLIEASAVILLGILSAIFFIPFIMVVMGFLYGFGEINWRVINVVRPLLLVLLGAYYPRYLMPLAGYIVSALIPSSHIIEVIQRLLTGNIDALYALTLIGVATALFIAYLPTGVHGINMWEKRKIREGVKTE